MAIDLVKLQKQFDDMFNDPNFESDFIKFMNERSKSEPKASSTMTILKPAPEGKLPEREKTITDLPNAAFVFGEYIGKRVYLKYLFNLNAWKFFNQFTKEWEFCFSTVIWYESVEVPDELLKDY